jgi:hypothetical protein
MRRAAPKSQKNMVDAKTQSPLEQLDAPFINVAKCLTKTVSLIAHLQMLDMEYGLARSTLPMIQLP